MIPPSNWDQELNDLRKLIESQLNKQANAIVREAISNILGRVKIVTSTNLEDGEYHWMIETINYENKS